MITLSQYFDANMSMIIIMSYSVTEYGVAWQHCGQSLTYN